MPTTGQNRKELAKKAKAENEKRWYQGAFGQKEPEFKPFVRQGEISYKLDSKTTVFAPAGTDINVLKARYNIK